MEHGPTAERSNGATWRPWRWQCRYGAGRAAFYYRRLGSDRKCLTGNSKEVVSRNGNQNQTPPQRPQRKQRLSEKPKLAAEAADERVIGERELKSERVESNSQKPRAKG